MTFRAHDHANTFVGQLCGACALRSEASGLLHPPHDAELGGTPSARRSVTLDATVTVGPNKLIDEGFLCALRDPDVVRLAERYGDPIDLLEAGVL